MSEWRVEFRVTVDDYVNWWAFALTHDAALREQARRGQAQVRGLVWMLASVLVLMLLLEYRSWREASVSAAGAVAIVLVASIVVLLIRHERGKRITPAYLAMVRRMTEAGGDYPRTHVITLNDRGMVDESERGRWEYYWSHGVESVARTPEQLFIYTFGGGAYIISRESFEGTGITPDEFAAEIRRRVEAAGGPASARALREHLASRDVPCPDCGYNLRGLVFPRCPECGLQVTLVTLTRATESSAAR